MNVISTHSTMASKSSTRKRWAQACTECSSAKKKCEGGIPCERCTRLDLHCTRRQRKTRREEADVSSTQLGESSGNPQPELPLRPPKVPRRAAAAAGAGSSPTSAGTASDSHVDSDTGTDRSMSLSSTTKSQTSSVVLQALVPMVRVLGPDSVEGFSGLEGEDPAQVTALQNAAISASAMHQLAVFEPVRSFPTFSFVNDPLDTFLRFTQADRTTMGMPPGGCVLWTPPRVALHQAMLMAGCVHTGLQSLSWRTTVLRTVFPQANSLVAPLQAAFEAVDVTYHTHRRVWPVRGGSTLSMELVDPAFQGMLSTQQKQRCLDFTRHLSTAFTAAMTAAQAAQPLPQGPTGRSLAAGSAVFRPPSTASWGSDDPLASVTGDPGGDLPPLMFEARSCNGPGSSLVSLALRSVHPDGLLLVHLGFIWAWILSGTPHALAATYWAAAAAEAGVEPGPPPKAGTSLPGVLKEQWTHLCRGLQALRAEETGEGAPGGAGPHLQAAGFKLTVLEDGRPCVSTPSNAVPLPTQEGEGGQ